MTGPCHVPASNECFTCGELWNATYLVEINSRQELISTRRIFVSFGKMKENQDEIQTNINDVNFPFTKADDTLNKNQSIEREFPEHFVTRTKRTKYIIRNKII